MAQVERIGTGKIARLSSAISLAEGEAIQVSAEPPLVKDEKVYALYSTNGGVTFRKVTGAINNHGVLLDSGTSRNSLTGEGIFKIGITDTESDVVVVSG